jgi:hypothetical protein
MNDIVYLFIILALVLWVIAFIVNLIYNHLITNKPTVSAIVSSLTIAIVFTGGLFVALAFGWKYINRNYISNAPMFQFATKQALANNLIFNPHVSKQLLQLFEYGSA